MSPFADVGGNTRSCADTCRCDHRYDLKGSTVGRRASQKDRETGGVLKDQDLQTENEQFQLGSRSDIFLKQLERDAQFLRQQRVSEPWDTFGP